MLCGFILVWRNFLTNVQESFVKLLHYTCGGVFGCGMAANKTKAKKKAAFMVLVRLLKSARLCSEELEHTMWQVYGSRE